MSSKTTPAPRSLQPRRPAHGIDYFAVIRDRGRTEKQREWAVRVLRYGVRCVPNGGLVDRTWQQAAKGMGLPTEGLTDRQCRNRYRGQILRTIDYLIKWGIFDSRGTLWAGEPGHSEGRCMVFSVPAGVAQSVRAGQPVRPRRRAHSAPGAPNRGAPARPPGNFFSGEVCTPSGVSNADASPTSPLTGKEAGTSNGGASARVTVGSREGYERRLVHAARRRSEVAAVVAIGVLWQNGSVREGGSELAAHPAVLAAPVSTVARAMLGRALPGVSGALSAEWQAKLEAAARRIDHYAGQPGTWVEIAAAILEDWAEGGPGPWLDEAPYSLGALAVALRRQANLIRYGRLRRRHERLRPLAASTERQKHKRWQAARRELEHERPGAGRTLRRPRDL